MGGRTRLDGPEPPGQCPYPRMALFAGRACDRGRRVTRGADRGQWGLFPHLGRRLERRNCPAHSRFQLVDPGAGVKGTLGILEQVRGHRQPTHVVRSRAAQALAAAPVWRHGIGGTPIAVVAPGPGPPTARRNRFSNQAASRAPVADSESCCARSASSSAVTGFRRGLAPHPAHASSGEPARGPKATAGPGRRATGRRKASSGRTVLNRGLASLFLSQVRSVGGRSARINQAPASLTGTEWGEHPIRVAEWKESNPSRRLIGATQMGRKPHRRKACCN